MDAHKGQVAWGGKTHVTFGPTRIPAERTGGGDLIDWAVPTAPLVLFFDKRLNMQHENWKYRTRFGQDSVPGKGGQYPGLSAALALRATALSGLDVYKCIARRRFLLP